MFDPTSAIENRPPGIITLAPALPPSAVSQVSQVHHPSVSNEVPPVGISSSSDAVVTTSSPRSESTHPDSALVVSTNLGHASSEQGVPTPVVPAPSEAALPEVLTQEVPPPLLWAARLKTSLRNLKKCADPEFLDDGTPVVIAPDSVILESSAVWKDFLIAHFTTTPPPADKIYSDLNPIWGKFGNISVRKFSQDACLILIPSESTRNWVLDVGYWQAGNCAFTVSKWSPTANLQPQKLKSIPLWVILRNIPLQLYSLDGISIIASAIGEPMHTEKSRLSPVQVGEAKFKVEILLDKKLPSAIQVRDSRGNSVKIEASYPRVPPSYSHCQEFGHTTVVCSKSKGKKKKKGSGKELSSQPEAVTATTVLPAPAPVSALPIVQASPPAQSPPPVPVTTLRLFEPQSKTVVSLDVPSKKEGLHCPVALQSAVIGASLKAGSKRSVSKKLGSSKAGKGKVVSE